MLYVGLHDPERVESFSRTKQIGGAKEPFTSLDFEVISALVRQFDRVVTTPHILTEVSNLLGQLSGDVKERCFAMFARHVAEPTTIERVPPAKILTNTTEFVRFGIADTSTMQVAAEHYLVLTTDYKLYGYLHKNGLAAVNYNNYRYHLF